MASSWLPLLDLIFCILEFCVFLWENLENNFPESTGSLKNLIVQQWQYLRFICQSRQIRWNCRFIFVQSIYFILQFSLLQKEKKKVKKSISLETFVSVEGPEYCPSCEKTELSLPAIFFHLNLWFSSFSFSNFSGDVYSSYFITFFLF